MKKPPRAWSTRSVHGVDICKIDTLDGMTNLSQITWNWPGFKTKSPVRGKPEWLVPDFRFVHFAICMLFLNFYKSGKEKKINKEKMFSTALHCPQDRVQTPFLRYGQLLQRGPCVSLHFHVLPHSLPPLRQPHWLLTAPWICLALSCIN